MAFDEIGEAVRVPAENHPPRLGSLTEQRVELGGERFGPGDDERFECVELERGARDQGAEIPGGSGEDTYAPFLKKGRCWGEPGDGVSAKLGGGGVGPEHGLFMVRAD